jgi:hypothetical protein
MEVDLLLGSIRSGRLLSRNAWGIRLIVCTCSTWQILDGAVTSVLNHVRTLDVVYAHTAIKCFVYR